MYPIEKYQLTYILFYLELGRVAPSATHGIWLRLSFSGRAIIRLTLQSVAENFLDGSYSSLVNLAAYELAMLSLVSA